MPGAVAPYAADPAQSRGRRAAEPPAPTRSEFQRDRDRIVHSTAFRRLVYKTQVFVNHEGDLYRTRLTHSLEVAQLGRAIARSLGLEEDLVEAIALAHDLGHTPFGHAGQDALHECMREYGGFEHNLQSLRVVDRLEHRYAAFDGLNLCFETREGILKRCSRAHAVRLDQREPGGVATRFLVGGQPSLEAQVCNLADEIAYNTHDIDDGARAGLLDVDELSEACPLVARCRAAAHAAHPALMHGQARRELAETLRRVLSVQVYDLVDATRAALAPLSLRSVEEVRCAPALVRFGDAMRRDVDAVKAHLFRSLYRHPRVVQTTDRARVVVRELFEAYWALPSGEGPGAGLRDRRRARAIADYVAGMTDRYAQREHERLTGRRIFEETPACGAAAS